MDAISADKLAAASSGVTSRLGIRRFALNSRSALTTTSVAVVPNSRASLCAVAWASALRTLSCLRVLAGIEHLLAQARRAVHCVSARRTTGASRRHLPPERPSENGVD